MSVMRILPLEALSALTSLYDCKQPRDDDAKVEIESVYQADLKSSEFLRKVVKLGGMPQQMRWANRVSGILFGAHRALWLPVVDQSDWGSVECRLRRDP